MMKFQLSIKSCKNRGTCKICKDKQSTGLYGFRFKRKSKSNDGTNATDPTVNSNCADVSCAAATISQVINMCLVPVRVKHSDSDKKVKTIALLDTCSQGKLVTEDLTVSLVSLGLILQSISRHLMGTKSSHHHWFKDSWFQYQYTTDPLDKVAKIIYKKGDTTRICGNSSINQVETMKISKQSG